MTPSFPANAAAEPAAGLPASPFAESASPAPDFAPISHPSMTQTAEPTAASASDAHLLSQEADASVSGAFSALAHTILAQNARTLEDLVAEMLQPMLKSWLDENLPALVERLVQEEIERVSRGRR